MAYPKTTLLDKAFKVANSHARSGNTTRSAEDVLRKVYEELKSINDESE